MNQIDLAKKKRKFFVPFLSGMHFIIIWKIISFIKWSFGIELIFATGLLFFYISSIMLSKKQFLSGLWLEGKNIWLKYLSGCLLSILLRFSWNWTCKVVSLGGFNPLNVRSWSLVASSNPRHHWIVIADFKAARRQDFTYQVWGPGFGDKDAVAVKGGWFVRMAVSGPAQCLAQRASRMCCRPAGYKPFAVQAVERLPLCTGGCQRFFGIAFAQRDKIKFTPQNEFCISRDKTLDHVKNADHLLDIGTPGTIRISGRRMYAEYIEGVVRLVLSMIEPFAAYNPTFSRVSLYIRWKFFLL